LSILKSLERIRRRRRRKKNDETDSFFFFCIVWIFFSKNIIDAYRFGTIVIVVSFNQVFSLFFSLFLKQQLETSHWLFSSFDTLCARRNIQSIIIHRNTSNALLDFFFFFFFSLLLSIFLFPSLTFGDCLLFVHKRLVAVRNHVSVQPVRCSSIPIFQIR